MAPNARASGEGHPLSVLAVTYPGGRTRQFSLRRELVPEVRRWRDNYQKLKEALKAICELNHQFVPMQPHQSAGESGVIELRRAQLSDKLFVDEVTGLREDCIDHADKVLDDEEILTVVYEALGKRHHLSRTRGWKGTSTEVALRPLVLKHVRNWSFDVLEREARANLVYQYMAHLETPYFKKFRVATNDIVKSRKLIDAAPIVLGAKAK
jgi:hypothetical protein